VFKEPVHWLSGTALIAVGLGLLPRKKVTDTTKQNKKKRINLERVMLHPFFCIRISASSRLNQPIGYEGT